MGQADYLCETFFIAEGYLMKIIAQCPGCGKSWMLTETAVDCRVRCRYCRLLFKVPELSEMPEAAEKLHSAKGQIYVDQDGKTYG